ncbi:MAG: hypothetical protein EA401_03700 [Planctomycetota bacterium]|nr:MAG: hypothetical protein EA401_03700 [Planctomycetota bacterium]
MFGRTPTSESRQRPRWQRWLRLLAWCIAGGAAVLVILVVFARSLLGPIAIPIAEHQLARQLGGEWRIGGIERLSLRGITIRNVEQVAADPDGKFQHFSADHLRLDIRIGDLLRDPMRAMRSGSARNVHLHLDLDRQWWRPPEVTAAAQKRNDDDREPRDPLHILRRFHPDLRVDLQGALHIDGIKGIGDGHPLRAAVHAHWEDGQVHVEELQAGIGTGTASLNGIRWSPNNGVTDVAQATFETVRIGPWPRWDPGHFSAEIHREGSWLVLDGWASGPAVEGQLSVLVDSRLGTIPWQDLATQVHLEGTASMPEPGQGLVAVEARSHGRIGYLHSNITVQGEALHWPGLPSSDVHIALSGFGQQVELDAMSIRGEEVDLDLGGMLRGSWHTDGSWNVYSSDQGAQLIEASGDRHGIHEADVVLYGLPVSTLRSLVPFLAEQQATATLMLRVLDQGQRIRSHIHLDDVVAANSGATSRRQRMHLRLQGDPDGVRAYLLSQLDQVAHSLDGSIRSDNAFRATWDWFSQIPDLPVEGSLELEDGDLGQLRSFFPNLGTVRGMVSGVLSLSGPLGAPLWEGSILLKDGGMSVGSGLPPLTDVSGDLHFAASHIEVERLHGRMGRAPVQFAGTWSLDPSREHDLRIEGRQALLVETPDFRLRADLDLRLQGFPGSMALAGNIGITDMLYSEPFQWMSITAGGGVDDPFTQLFAIDVEPWRSMTFDVSVRDGSIHDPQARVRGVQLANNLVRSRLLLDLHIGGTGAVPEPQGTISGFSGNVLLPFTSYVIDQVVITFPDNEPFDPFIEANLRARMAGYTVRMQLSGRVRDPRLTVNTTPGLTPEEAFVLATTGLPPAEAGGESQAAALAVALPFVARQLRQAIFGPPDPDAPPTQLDRLALVLDEERSESGVSSARIEIFLWPRWYAFVERDKFEEFNAGLLFRRTIGQEPEDPLAHYGDERVRPLPHEWLFVVRDGQQDWQPGERRLRRMVRRHRRGFDASEGDLLHAADAVSTIRAALRQSGHAQAEVELGTPAGESRAQVDVRFLLNPGPRWYFGDFRIDGAPARQQEAIRDIVSAHLAGREQPFTQGAMRAVRTEVSQQLQLDGYPAVQVAVDHDPLPEGGGRVGVHVEIVAGTRYHFAQPTFSGIDDLASEIQEQLYAAAKTLAGRPWLPRTAIATRASLTGIMQDSGYYRAQVWVELQHPEEYDGDHEEPSLSIAFTIDPGPRMSIQSISLDGLSRTHESYARKRLQLRPGVTLERNVVHEGMNRMRATIPLRRLSMRVEDDPDDPSQGHLHIEMEEAPSRHFDIHLGYGSWEGVRGGVSYTDDHLFGRGRQWTIGGDASEKHHQAHTSLTDFDLLGGDRRLTLSADAGYREHPSFTQTRFATGPQAIIPLTERQTLIASYRLSLERTTEIRVALTPEDLDRSRLRVAIADLQWGFQGLDDPWRPRRGWRWELGVGLADPLVGSQVPFVELRARSGVVTRLWGDDITVALHVNAVTRKPTDGSDSLPISQRLFLGGSNSVRSFGKDRLGPGERGNPAGGLTAAFAQAELRYRLFADFYAATFYDIGSVSPDPVDISEEFGQAIGGGIRYLLPVGPVRLDAAYNPGKRLASKRPWAVHFALGFTF